MIPHSRPWITSADRALVDATLASGLIADGRTVGQFERAVAEYMNAGHAVATSHGRHALALLLLALGVGAGDEVIIPTYACPSIAGSVRMTGARPVPCDAGDDWCLDADSAARSVGARTRAVVVAHIFGVAAEIDRLVVGPVAVIEDCAQAFGARDAAGQGVGTKGVAAFCSFQARFAKGEA